MWNSEIVPVQEIKPVIEGEELWVPPLREEILGISELLEVLEELWDEEVSLPQEYLIVYWWPYTHTLVGGTK